jgi:hypothetical protein
MIMGQLVHFKSNFGTSKLILIWMVLLLVLILPWMGLLFQFDKGIAVFVILTNMMVFAVILYSKISLKVIIHPQGQVIEYYWIMLWGRRRQLSINIKNAHINLDIIKLRGNDLWNLIIIDNKELGKKVSLTEITDGFDGQQIRYMYQVLKQVSVN